MVDWTPAETAAALEKHDIVLIDVREPHEYSEARIAGALNFPLSTFDPAALPTSAGREVVLHCGTGKRSGMALAKCKAASVPVTIHLGGGITAWKQAGLATLSVDPSTGQIKRS